jgi:fumarate reductase flavoprotein subunit
LAPFQPVTLGQHWRGTGADQLLTAMWKRFMGRGGTACFGARAVRLVTRTGSVTGVEFEVGRRTATLNARAVLIADGGFQANADMVRHYITPTYRLRGADTDTGDGIRMGIEVGAHVVNMDSFYGHCMARDALWDNQLWPMLSLYPIIAVSLVVDRDGRRFADEGVSNQHMAQAIARSTEPGGNWVVFDQTVWEGAARAEPLPPNPTLVERGATVITAGSLAELARAIDVPNAALDETVRAFNAHATINTQLSPTRTGQAIPVQVPPFYALPAIAGITFTMGGLLVNQNAQGLTSDGLPIRGLYAAGGAMGGLQGGPKPAYAGGWSEAATFGLLAAEHCVASIP